MTKIDDGTYYVRYGGAFGSGEAQFIFKGGEVFGSDVGGGQYFGKCTPVAGTDKVELSLNLKMLMANFLVFDGKQRAAGDQVPIKLTLSPADLGKPIAATIMGYPLTLIVTKTGPLPLAA